MHLGETTLLKHIFNIEAGHIDGVAGRSVLAHIGSLAEELVIAGQNDVLSGGKIEEFLLEDHNGQTSGANVLLGTNVDEIEFFPLDVAATKVGAHVTDNFLALGHLVPWEFVELEALDRLILAEVEESGLFLDVPLLMRSNRAILEVLVPGHFVGVAELLGLLDGTFTPCAGGHIVGSLEGSTLTEQVLADSRELLGGTTLEEHDLVSVWNRHKSAEISTGLLNDGGKSL